MRHLRFSIESNDLLNRFSCPGTAQDPALKSLGTSISDCLTSFQNWCFSGVTNAKSLGMIRRWWGKHGDSFNVKYTVCKKTMKPGRNRIMVIENQGEKIWVPALLD